MFSVQWKWNHFTFNDHDEKWILLKMLVVCSIFRRMLFLVTSDLCKLRSRKSTTCWINSFMLQLKVYFYFLSDFSHPCDCPESRRSRSRDRRRSRSRERKRSGSRSRTRRSRTGSPAKSKKSDEKYVFNFLGQKSSQRFVPPGCWKHFIPAGFQS